MYLSKQVLVRARRKVDVAVRDVMYREKMRARIVGSVAPIVRGLRLNSRQTAPWTCNACYSRQSRIRQYSTPHTPEQKPFYITTPIFYVNAGTDISVLS